jgi:hypothetical protein
LPVQNCITIEPIEIVIDEEQELAHHRSNGSEDLGYDQHGRLLQRPDRGVIIDFRC